MGQQQLLLIVLGVIIVGIAIVVGINLFNANSVSANRDAVIADLQNIAALAHQYYIRPSAMGGGQNSFAGFDDTKLSQAGLASNANGKYSVKTAGDQNSITFEGVGTGIVTGTTHVTVDLKVNAPQTGVTDSVSVVN